MAENYIIVSGIGEYEPAEPSQAREFDQLLNSLGLSHDSVAIHGRDVGIGAAEVIAIVEFVSAIGGLGFLVSWGVQAKNALARYRAAYWERLGDTSGEPHPPLEADISPELVQYIAIGHIRASQSQACIVASCIDFLIDGEWTTCATTYSPHEVRPDAAAIEAAVAEARRFRAHCLDLDVESTEELHTSAGFWRRGLYTFRIPDLSAGETHIVTLSSAGEVLSHSVVRRLTARSKQLLDMSERLPRAGVFGLMRDL